MSQFLILLFSLLFLAAPAFASQDLHALSLHGTPRYDKNFTHFDYANPHAPKGGTLKYAAVGQFDSFNPFILKGVPASGMGDYFFETLLTPSYDEAATHYGLIAEAVTFSPDKKEVTFRLRREARFHDGQPITAHDVAFSFNMLTTQGHPFYALYFRDVTDVKVKNDHLITFTLSENAARELPLTLGTSLPILHKKWWQDKEFDKPLLAPPVGSGPYHIKSFDLGTNILYERLPDYWGKSLAVNRGRYNFDLIHIDYYRDHTVALEAFRSHDYDFRLENQAKSWANNYNFDEVRQGKVIKEEVSHKLPSGMQGFVFNMRRAPFDNRNVRRALTLAYDFPWANKNLFHNAYTRSNSYFSNSELAATATPSAEELQLLAPFKDQLPAEIFTQEFRAPEPQGNNMREQIRKAKRLLAQEGWVIQDQQLTHKDTGQVFSFEILLRNPQFERVTAPYIQNLKRLGITATIRLLQDDSQYQKKLDEFDFDMVVAVFPSSLTPGNELRDLFSSIAGQTKGNRNLAGINNQAIDALIELVIASPDRAAMLTRSRALDRALLWGFYVIPHWHLGSFRIAWWNLFSRPNVQPPYNLNLDFWWYDKNKVAQFKNN